MSRFISLLLLGFALLSQPAMAAQQFYSWVDDLGRKHYSSQRPIQQVQQLRIETVRPSVIETRKNLAAAHQKLVSNRLQERPKAMVAKTDNSLAGRHQFERPHALYSDNARHRPKRSQ